MSRKAGKQAATTLPAWRLETGAVGRAQIRCSPGTLAALTCQLEGLPIEVAIMPPSKRAYNSQAVIRALRAADTRLKAKHRKPNPVISYPRLLTITKFDTQDDLQRWLEEGLERTVRRHGPSLRTMNL